MFGYYRVPQPTPDKPIRLLICSLAMLYRAYSIPLDCLREDRIKDPRSSATEDFEFGDSSKHFSQAAL